MSQKMPCPTCRNRDSFKAYCNKKFDELRDYVTTQNSGILEALAQQAQLINSLRDELAKKRGSEPCYESDKNSVAEDDYPMMTPEPEGGVDPIETKAKHTEGERPAKKGLVPRSSIREVLGLEDKIRKDFPIASKAELARVNAKINENNRDIYVKVVKHILRDKVARNLKEVLSVDVVVQFNLDGTHGKERLRSYANVYEVLYDALNSEDAEKDLRNAMQTVKKSYFRQVCQAKKYNSFVEVKSDYN